jgi:hypothetical protein
MKQRRGNCENEIRQNVSLTRLMSIGAVMIDCIVCLLVSHVITMTLIAMDITHP